MPPTTQNPVELKFNSARQRDGIEVIKETDLKPIPNLIGQPSIKIVLKNNAQTLEPVKYKLVFCVQATSELQKFSFKASIKKANPTQPDQLQLKKIGDGEWTKFPSGPANVYNFYYLTWDWDQSDPFMSLDNYDVMIDITHSDFKKPEVVFTKQYGVTISNQEIEKKERSNQNN